jgi:hypothetical protein
MKKALSVIVSVLVASGLMLAQQQAGLFKNAPPAIAGKYIASAYNGWQVHSSNSVAAGAGTMTLDNCYPTMGQSTNPRPIFPFAVNVPVTIIDGANTETGLAVTSVTQPTANTASSTNAFSCAITATFANAHGGGVSIISGDNGLAEAINDAHSTGGVVVLDPGSGVTDAQINTTTALFHNVGLEDVRSGPVKYWNLQGTGTTYLAAPTTLTAVTALPSATPVGAFGTGTYFMCVSYVDVAGQEGPCSATFSQAGLATGSFIFSGPAASTGAVGYTIYISLTSGTYSLAYQVPLTSSVCTLTTVETITPACAVANTTYGQSAATATVTAITVNTSPVDMQVGGVSGTLLTGNPNGRTTYAYVPSSRLASSGIPTTELAFTVGGIGSATPISIGTVNLPAGFMNQVGKTLRVCGKFLNTDVNSSVQNINFYWDAAGSNTAGSPVKIGGLQATGTGTAAAYEGSFCENFVTTVSGAGATAGSMLPSAGNLNYALVSTGNIVGNGSDTIAAAVGSLNLAGGGGFSNRLSIVHTNTTGNNTPQLQTLTLEVL